MHGDSLSLFSVRSVRPEDFPALIAMYILCFAEAPWREVFTPKEVRADFEHMMSLPRSAFVVICEGDRVIGAAIGYPVAEKSQVQKDLPAADQESFYVAEIFIDPTRRNRLASVKVTLALLDAAHEQGFARYSVRTSVDQPRIIRLFTDHRKGTEVARQEVTSLKSIGGEMQEVPDTRVLMTGPIR